MNIEEFREYCIAKPGVTEELPFGPDTLVFKVMGKMFAASGIDNFESINLKCDPEKALELRAEYGAVKPGWHMNKKHWNTVMVNEDASVAEIRGWIDDSYTLVARSLTKKLREELANLH